MLLCDFAYSSGEEKKNSYWSEMMLLQVEVKEALRFC